VAFLDEESISNNFSLEKNFLGVWRLDIDDPYV